MRGAEAEGVVVAFEPRWRTALRSCMELLQSSERVNNAVASSDSTITVCEAGE
jgi:hypothetical protein